MQVTRRKARLKFSPLELVLAVWRTPSVTVARLLLDSYFRSVWLWGEVVLVLAFFTALFFPFLESRSYFYGTSNFDMGGIAILGAAMMVRHSTSARVYVLLARLPARAAYSRGLMLATALLRIPLFLLLLVLVLITGRLIDPAVGPMAIGAIGLLPNIILVSVLTVALSSPMARQIDRIFFLAWLAAALFSLSPIIQLPAAFINVLSIVRIPILPLAACFQVSTSGNIGWSDVWAFVVIVIYIVGLVWLAGYWLERRELLLH